MACGDNREGRLDVFSETAEVGEIINKKGNWNVRMVCGQ